MARVFVTRRLPGTALERLTAAGHDVDAWTADGPASAAEIRAHAAEAEALLPQTTEPVDAELIAAAPRLRVVANFGVGTDNIDFAAAAERGIAVGNTPDVLTDATADLAFALLLAAARNLVPAAADVRAGRWTGLDPSGWLGRDLHGATIVVVGGRGRIGGAFVKRAEAFGMHVVIAGRGDDLVPLLPDADFVSLHTPL